MCMVSLVMDAGARIPGAYWNTSTLSEFQEIIKRLDALDKKLDQPECHDPAKAAWMREIEERLARLEK